MGKTVFITLMSAVLVMVLAHSSAETIETLQITVLDEFVNLCKIMGKYLLPLEKNDIEDCSITNLIVTTLVKDKTKIDGLLEEVNGILSPTKGVTNLRLEKKTKRSAIPNDFFKKIQKLEFSDCVDTSFGNKESFEGMEELRALVFRGKTPLSNTITYLSGNGRLHTLKCLGTEYAMTNEMLSEIQANNPDLINTHFANFDYEKKTFQKLVETKTHKTLVGLSAQHEISVNRPEKTVQITLKADAANIKIPMDMFDDFLLEVENITVVADPKAEEFYLDELWDLLTKMSKLKNMKLSHLKSKDGSVGNVILQRSKIINEKFPDLTLLQFPFALKEENSEDIEREVIAIKAKFMEEGPINVTMMVELDMGNGNINFIGLKRFDNTNKRSLSEADFDASRPADDAADDIQKRLKIEQS